MNNMRYQDDELRSKQKADIYSQTQEGSVITTETYKYDDPRDIIRRFIPKEHYVDSEAAARAGHEMMLFGGGPNVEVNKINQLNAQLFNNYQQLGAPQITPGQAKLKERILGQNTSRTANKDLVKEELDQYDRDSMVPFSLISNGQPYDFFHAGITKAGDPVHIFHSAVTAVNKADWDQGNHFKLLKAKYGEKDYLSAWKDLKEYLSPYIQFNESGNQVIITTRNGQKLGMNSEAKDILSSLFSGLQKGGGQTPADPNEANKDDNSYKKDTGKSRVEKKRDEHKEITDRATLWTGKE